MDNLFLIEQWHVIESPFLHVRYSVVSIEERLYARGSNSR